MRIGKEVTLQKHSNKNILLTGATGFLGSHLLRAFLKKKWNVSIIKRSFSNTWRIDDLLSKIHYIDIDKDPFETIFKRQGPFNAVVHTATCQGRSEEKANQIVEANLVFPLHLLETAVRFNTAFFFNAATILNTYLNSYALSKQQFSDWGRIFAQEKKIAFINLKQEHIYGPDDGASKFTSYIFKSLCNNVPKIELTLGEQKRDFIYIDDVVQLYIILLEKTKQKKGFIEYEIGYGNAISIREFVETTKIIAGADTNLKFGVKPYRKHEVMFFQANIDELKKMGWTPKFSIKDGITESLKDF